MSNVAGYIYGRPACSCQIAWLPVYEAELLRRGLLRASLDVFQLIGFAPQSKGIHGGGGANDTAQMSDAQLTVSRNMGCADSPRHTWQGFTDAHAHGVLKGCPHATAGAKAQVREIDGRGDGLVGNRSDIGPRKGVKWPLRTWKSGIKWAASQLYDQAAKKHAAKKYRVTTDKLAGRSYPGVGPVLIRRKKGFKIAATATYTAPDGTKHVRTKYGTWYALRYLVEIRPAAPKPAPPKQTKAVKHEGRPALGAKVGRAMTWNLGILNPVGAARWVKVRTNAVKIIRANAPDFLFLQETPSFAAKWLAAQLNREMRRVGSHSRPVFVRVGIPVLGWAMWTPKTRAKGGKSKPVTFVRIELRGERILLVNCHPQAGDKHTVIREKWADEVLDEAERRARGDRLVFGGDFQRGEFARKAKARGYLRSISTAHETVNGELKSFNDRSETPVEGYQMDQIISDLFADEHRLIWNDDFDHNRVRADLHIPA